MKAAIRKKNVATTSPSPSANDGDKIKEDRSRSFISASSNASSVEVSQRSTTDSCSPNSVRFSVLGIAGITVNAPNLEKMQKLEGDKESSYYSSPSKMRSVVTITSNNKVVGITDLSKPMTPAHSTFQKDSHEHRHLAFWANEQELTLGSGMSVQSIGAETFHMTIGLTDGILPAMPIGTACLVLDAKQMMDDGRIAAVIDLPVQTAADKKMISVDSHVETSSKKKKKKKWFTRSTKEPSKPQQLDFHSVYATDKTGDAILRIQIHLKPEEQELSVETTVDNTVDSESKTSTVKSKSSAKSKEEVQRSRTEEPERNQTAEVQRHRTEEVQRHRTEEVQRHQREEVQRHRTEEVQRHRTEEQEVKHNLVDLDDSVADSEDNVSIEDNILEAYLPSGEDKGISIEEYKMFQVLASKRSSLEKSRTGVLYDTQPPKQEETKEAEGAFASMFRGAMDMAISNFFTPSRPIVNTSAKVDTGPEEEGIEISLPCFSGIDEASSTLNYSLETAIIRPTEEVDTAMHQADTDNLILAGTDSNDNPKKALTARELMVQNLEKKSQPSNSNAQTPASHQEETDDDAMRGTNAPLHLEATGHAQGLPPSGREAAGAGLPPKPSGRPPRPTTSASKPPLPPIQARSRGRDPNIPSSIMAGPIAKSWTLLDDDSYTLTMEGSFQVAPGNGHHETKDAEPVGLNMASLGASELARAMKTNATPKKPDDDEVSLRVPAVIIQYDHMSVAYDELTVDTRDFTPLWSSKNHRNNNMPKRPGPRSRTMKKRANRTVGPDDESAGSAEDSISAFIKEVDMQLFDEDEVESLLQI